MIADGYKVIELNSLLKATRDITKAKDFQSIAQVIFDFIYNLKSYNMAVIYSIDKLNNELEVVACRGSDIKKLKKRVPFKIGEGAVGWVAKEKKALLIDDVLEASEISVRQFFDEDPLIRSFLAVPLIVGNKLVGILDISSSKPNNYKKTDVEMISIIASQGAALLELNNEMSEARKISNYILENMNSGVLVIDNDYKIISFNKAAEKITGYTCKEVIGRNILDIPLKASPNDWFIVDSLINGKTYFEQLTYIINKESERVSIRLSTSILKNEKHMPTGCICIFRDNTETERLQQQMIKAEKLASIGRLTSGITHEIRNPLLPIRTASKFLVSKMSNMNVDKDILRLLSIIDEESERLNRFLDQLASINRGVIKMRGKALLIETIEETLILIRHSLKKGDIKLIKDYSCRDRYVPFTKDQLKQIFLNLFLNAIDAINNDDKNKKEISIKIFTCNDKTIIKLKDSGTGISDEKINDIFDYFYSTKPNGTGLGLPIVNNLIESSGGKILVQSEEGLGTTFTIEIPLVEKGCFN